MMETLQDMMGTMKEMAKGAIKRRSLSGWNAMDALMKELLSEPLRLCSGGYAQLYQKDGRWFMK